MKILLKIIQKSRIIKTQADLAGLGLYAPAEHRPEIKTGKIQALRPCKIADNFGCQNPITSSKSRKIKLQEVIVWANEYVFYVLCLFHVCILSLWGMIEIFLSLTAGVWKLTMAKRKERGNGSKVYLSPSCPRSQFFQFSVIIVFAHIALNFLLTKKLLCGILNIYDPPDSQESTWKDVKSHSFANRKYTCYRGHGNL